MSRHITDFFKVTSRRKLLSNKNSDMASTPKRVKSLEESSIIDLVSDDEQLCEAMDIIEKKLCNDNNISLDGLDSSCSTIIYSPSTPRKSLTPLSMSSKSSGSKKYFSPVKKKNVRIHSPMKGKKNLTTIMNEVNEDSAFAEACLGMDDKSIFLLTIINEYLNDKELRPLLLAESQDLLSKCMHTKKPGMRLVCRLYWRKEGWYRLDQVRQISSEKKNDPLNDPVLHDMIEDLIKNDLIESVNYPGSKHKIDMEDCLTLLKSEELKAICKDLKLKANNKTDYKECLKNYSNLKSNISSYLIGSKSDNASRVLKILNLKAGPCFRLKKEIRQTLNELYMLIYLGIDPSILAEKRLELILINDKIKRECFPVDKDMPVDNASVVFKTRDEFERYILASKVYEEFLATTILEDKCCIVKNVYQLYKDIDNATMKSYKELPQWLQRFTPLYLYVKILEEGIQELKKTKSDVNIALALKILSELISQNMVRLHRKDLWYAEKALILDKFMSSPEEAAQVLLEGFASSMSDIAKDHMRPRAIKIATRKTNGVSAELRDCLMQHATKDQIMERNLNAHHIYKLPMESHKSKGKIKFETRTADGRVVQEVEDFCISRYIADGKYTHGVHCEGRMVTTIFFLLFWDIIYARLRGVRGIYLSHYQQFPLDMFLDSFYVNRRTVIDDRLKDIEETSIHDLVEQMEQMWNLRPETELSGINRALGWENISSVCLCMKPRWLAAVCRRLATDYRYSHSGFPDLTLWNENTNEIKFVEVKTDSDKPSMKQLQWMHYLQENGIETEFCYVGVNTMRCKARNRC